ncbi:uncharacterized protein (TIGR02246 family) [Methylohalomonas lacus]|uniref:Uncharacterized protein (TIGR02246 family) n=1 Tax=Methylohalomonas lacus TaxID=398773 RepID=A0AAE3HKL5_9GAMM|nr:SgcJ/EcaC family oxidoreductase [Methylohalomonas lacus]MCS3904080.1 uncharacterized protein (TIGR02246 family) [Methylohalomonas lacus]
MNGLKNTGKLYALALTGLLALGLTGPALADSATETAEELNRDWNRAFNSHNAEELASMYAEDALVSPASGKVIKGREAIQELFQGYIDNGLKKHRITVLRADASGKMLYQVAEWRASGKPKNAVIPLHKGILKTVFKRNDAGDWRIQSHVWNMEK